jgi:hypothetical protein
MQRGSANAVYTTQDDRYQLPVKNILIRLFASA